MSATTWPAGVLAGILLLAAPARPAGVETLPAPRGHLVAIGGGARPASVMALFACLAGGADARVLVVPHASELPDTGDRLREDLQALGLGHVAVLAVDRAGADTDDAVRQVEGATGVYFAGGDQGRLMAVLHGTRVARALGQRYRDGAAMAGTSAGAAVMSHVMITGDERRPFSKDDSWQTIEADNVVTAEGLGFLDAAVVDQHFVRRRRHNRLISLVLEQPRLLGLAIDEATAAWVKPDGTLEVVGDGPLLVYDAHDARTVHDQATRGLSGAGVRLHVLRSGARYDLGRREVLGLERAATGGPGERCAPRP